MKAYAIMLKPIRYGWAVTVPDGRELARFTGPGAKRRALLFIHGGRRRTPAPGDAARY